MRRSALSLRSACLISGLAALLFAMPVQAQIGPFAVGAKASTLGLGVEATMRLTGPLALRASYNSYTISTTSQSDDSEIDFDVKLKLQGTPITLDLHPTGGSFRISGGMVFNTPTGELTATNATTMTIGGDTYNPGEVGRLKGEIHGRKNAPYLGIGFDNAVFSRSRISFGFDLGVVAVGTLEPGLTAETSLSGAAKAQLDANIDRELQKVRDQIADLPAGAKYYPVIGLSLKLRF